MCAQMALLNSVAGGGQYFAAAVWRFVLLPAEGARVADVPRIPERVRQHLLYHGNTLRYLPL